jgi:hypothetical protein
VIAALALFLGLRRTTPATVSQAAMPAPVTGQPLPAAPPVTGQPAGATQPAAGRRRLGLRLDPARGRRSPAAGPAPSNGIPFGRYMLLERLGEGGMAAGLSQRSPSGPRGSGASSWSSGCGPS